MHLVTRESPQHFNNKLELQQRETTIFVSAIVNFHRDIFSEAGESLLEARRAAQHSQDETLVISISPDAFRGRREKKGGGAGKDAAKNPERFRLLHKKTPKITQ